MNKSRKNKSYLYFDRFDIVEAYYIYCLDYHNGMFSRLYKTACYILHQLKYKPSVSSNCDYDSLSENAKAIYDHLVSINYQGKSNL